LTLPTKCLAANMTAAALDHMIFFSMWPMLLEASDILYMVGMYACPLQPLT
jgi:hypothetical protein